MYYVYNADVELDIGKTILVPINKKCGGINHLRKKLSRKYRSKHVYLRHTKFKGNVSDINTNLFKNIKHSEIPNNEPLKIKVKML